jgi:hypothetical protein
MAGCLGHEFAKLFFVARIIVALAECGRWQWPEPKAGPDCRNPGHFLIVAEIFPFLAESLVLRQFTESSERLLPVYFEGMERVLDQKQREQKRDGAECDRGPDADPLENRYRIAEAGLGQPLRCRLPAEGDPYPKR